MFTSSPKKQAERANARADDVLSQLGGQAGAAVQDLAAARPPQKYDYIKDNLRTMFTKPWALAVEVDQAYVQHATTALIAAAKFSYETAQKRRERETSAERSAASGAEHYDRGEQALDRGELHGIPTYKVFQDRLQTGVTAAGFRATSSACHLLADYAGKLARMEFMAKTQTGQAAYQKAAAELGEMARVATEAWQEHQAILKRCEGKAPTDRVDKETWVAYTTWTGKYKGRTKEVAIAIKRLSDECVAAVNFEAVKAYVVTQLETKKVKDKDPADEWIKQVNKLQTTTAGAFATAAGNIPGQGGTIASAVSSFVTSGSTVVERAVTGARRKRKIDMIMKDPAKMAKVEQAFLDDPLIMAKYLYKKYMWNLEYNLKLLDPIVFGAGVGADIASHGVPVGKILALIWDETKVAVLQTARNFQKARINEARTKFNLPKKTKEEAGSAAKEVWHMVDNALGAELQDKILTVVSTSLDVSNWVKDASQFADPATLRKWLTEWLIDKISDEVLAKMEVPPADLFDQQKFFDTLEEGRNVGAEALALLAL